MRRRRSRTLTEHGDIYLSASFVLQQYQHDHEKEVSDEEDDNPDDYDIYYDNEKDVSDEDEDNPDDYDIYYDNEKDVSDEDEDNPDEHDFYRAWVRSLMRLHAQKYLQRQNKQQ